MKDLGIIIVGAAVGAYLLFGKKSGEGGTGGGSGEVLTPGFPDMLSGSSIVPAPDTGFVPSSYLTGLIAKKGSTNSVSSTSYLSGVPVSSATGAFQSSYPVVMYDSSKGGNQLAVKSAPQSKPLPSIFSKLTGGLGTSSDLKLKKSSSSSGSAVSYGGGNSAGSSSTLHSRMGVR